MEPATQRRRKPERTCCRNGMILEEVELSTSGRPRLVEGEVQCATYGDADLEFDGVGGLPGRLGNKYVQGYLLLTTHRILWIDRKHLPQKGNSCAVPLGSVSRVAPPKLRLWKTPRMKLQVALDARSRITSLKLQVASMGRIVIPLRSKSENHKTFVSKLMDNIEKKTWPIRPAPLPSQPAPATLEKPYFPDPNFLRALPPDIKREVLDQYEEELQRYKEKVAEEKLPAEGERTDQPSSDERRFSTLDAGVSGILRREMDVQQKTDNSLEKAFKDLSALMEEAKGMVEIAQRLRDKLNASPDGPNRKENEEMGEMLLSLGIDTPVTKDNAGSLYHYQLARQLSDFLGPQLNKTGGVMPLVDAYCIYNRARGTDLISPNDMLKAALLFESLRLPMKLREFSNGVLTIEGKGHSAEAVRRRFDEMLESREYLTAQEVSATLSIPVILAQEHLNTIEGTGALCRDDSLEGLRFYPNIFTSELVVNYVAGHDIQHLM